AGVRGPAATSTGGSARPQVRAISRASNTTITPSTTLMIAQRPIRWPRAPPPPEQAGRVAAPPPRAAGRRQPVEGARQQPVGAARRVPAAAFPPAPPEWRPQGAAAAPQVRSRPRAAPGRWAGAARVPAPLRRRLPRRRVLRGP